MGERKRGVALVRGGGGVSSVQYIISRDKATMKGPDEVGVSLFRQAVPVPPRKGERERRKKVPDIACLVVLHALTSTRIESTRMDPGRPWDPTACAAAEQGAVECHYCCCG